MNQLSLLDYTEPKKRTIREEKRRLKQYRRLFWTAMQHPKRPTIGFTARLNYRLHYCIPGWFNLAYQCEDYQNWMYARRIRLWALVQGYDKRGNKAKADYYYSLYQEHTYHTN